MDTAAYSSLIIEVGQVTDTVKEFDLIHQDDLTYCYRRQCMHMVSTLVRFTWAIREGDWELYLLPWSKQEPQPSLSSPEEHG